MTSSCGVVVVGMGIAGKVRLRDLGQAQQWPETNHVKVIGYISRRELDIEGVKALTLDEALSREDVHVIVVATENSSHYDITKKSLEAGKHVLVEFPLATSAHDVKDLQEVAKVKGVRCHEEVISLMLEGHIALKEEIRRKPPLVEGKVTLSASYNGWIEKFTESGSPFTSAIFLIHGLVDLFGEVTPAEASLTVDEVGFSCTGKVMTKDKKAITIEIKRTAEKSPRMKEIYFKFEDGSVIDTLPAPPGGGQSTAPAPGLFMKDFIQFIQLVDKNTPVSPSSEQTLHCHKVADGLYELAKKG